MKSQYAAPGQPDVGLEHQQPAAGAQHPVQLAQGGQQLVGVGEVLEEVADPGHVDRAGQVGGRAVDGTWCTLTSGAASWRAPG